MLHFSSTGGHGEEGGEARKGLIPASFLQMGGHGSQAQEPEALRFPAVKVEVTEASIKLSNGFVLAEFDRKEPSLRHLAGGEQSLTPAHSMASGQMPIRNQFLRVCSAGCGRLPGHWRLRRQHACREGHHPRHYQGLQCRAPAS